MKAAMGLAEDTGHGASLDLAQVKERFAQWCLGRKSGERISNVLWAAVGLVEQHGLQRIAQALGIDGDQLKKPVTRGAGPARLTKASLQFIELFAQPAPSAGADPDAIATSGYGTPCRVARHSPGSSSMPCIVARSKPERKRYGNYFAIRTRTTFPNTIDINDFYARLPEGDDCSEIANNLVAPPMLPSRSKFA